MYTGVWWVYMTAWSVLYRAGRSEDESHRPSIDRYLTGCGRGSGAGAVRPGDAASRPPAPPAAVAVAVAVASPASHGIREI